jgi:hypothetical protein
LPSLTVGLLTLIQFKLLTVLRHFNLPTKALANTIRHRFRGIGFRRASQKLGGGADGMPSSHRTTSFQSACAEKPPDFFDCTFDRHPLAQDFHLFFAVSYATAQGSGRLIADEDDGGILIRQ